MFDFEVEQAEQARRAAIAKRSRDAIAALPSSSQRRKGTSVLRIVEGPYLVYRKDEPDVPIGIEAWIEMTVGGVAQDIDPHRVLINPPAEGLWDAIWASVENHPSPETRSERRRR